MSLLTAPEWREVSPGLLHAVVRGRHRIAYHLTVEMLPVGRWQWSAFRFTDPDIHRLGESSRLGSAMEKARLAAHSLVLVSHIEVGARQMVVP